MVVCPRTRWAKRVWLEKGNVARPALSRYVLEHIDGARYVELAGADSLFFVGDTGPLLDAIEEFVTGRLPRHDVDRVLATVMFTDVVSSTDQAAGMGDRRWSELLATHDGLTRAELERFHGREIRTTGDGFLATFDGPGRAVRCACAIRDAVRAIGINVRVGLHTGEIELHADDIGGIAVHIAHGQIAPGHAAEHLPALCAHAGVTRTAPTPPLCERLFTDTMTTIVPDESGSAAVPVLIDAAGLCFADQRRLAGVTVDFAVVRRAEWRLWYRRLGTRKAAMSRSLTKWWARDRRISSLYPGGSPTSTKFGTIR